MVEGDENEREKERRGGKEGRQERGKTKIQTKFITFESFYVYKIDHLKEFCIFHWYCLYFYLKFFFLTTSFYKFRYIILKLT